MSGRRNDAAAAMQRLQRALDLLTTADPPEAVIRGRAQTILEHLAKVPVAILIANNRSRYVDANRAATVLTGYSHAELLRMSLSDLTADPRRAAASRLWRDFLKRGTMSGKYPLRRKDGTTVVARYFAAANVLPGVHLSALAAEATPRRRKPA